MESDFSDVAMMSDSIPGQAEHEGIQLTGTEFQAGTNTAVPLKAATMQATRRQPQADAVMHEHLHAVGALVGKAVGMMRTGRTEDLRIRPANTPTQPVIELG